MGVTVLVFVSWSGRRSRAVANVLREWIPNVLQTVDVWMSDQDIEAGARWGAEVQRQLDTATFGIVVVTHDNQERPWLNFEAGAISKTVETDTRVVPFLVDAQSASELPATHPLSQFQAILTTSEGMTGLVTALNGAAERQLPPAQLAAQLQMWLPVWQTRLDEALAAAPRETPAAPARRPEQILEELLELARSSQRAIERLGPLRRTAQVRTIDGRIMRTAEDQLDDAESLVTFQLNAETAYDPESRTFVVATSEPISRKERDLLTGQLMAILPSKVSVRFALKKPGERGVPIDESGH